MANKIIIIGAGAVGMTVATFLKRHTDYNITVFSSDSHTAYSQCGMPFILGNQIPDLNDIIIKPQDTFIDMGIDLHLKTPVTNINIQDRKVTTGTGTFEYDDLVIATGSTPVIPQIPGCRLNGIFALHTLSDCKKINKAINKSSRVLIIGAGRIGCELAVCLAGRGLKITLVEAISHVLPAMLDPDMALVVKQYLVSLGIRVITGARVDSINRIRFDHVESVTVEDNTFPADAVIIAAGIRPQVDLIEKTDIDIGSTGGIVTDEYLRVSLNGECLNNVYAGGECAQVSNFITGSPMIAGLGAAARRMAQVIGENISNKSSVKVSTYPPTLIPTVIAIKDFAAGSVGITSKLAKKHDIHIVCGSSKGYSKANYYPGARQMYIKLIVSGIRLIGAQIVADSGVKERVDGLSLAIRMGATIDDLLTWETSYTPPLSMVIDPVTVAAYNVKKKMVK